MLTKGSLEKESYTTSHKDLLNTTTKILLVYNERDCNPRHLNGDTEEQFQLGGQELLLWHYHSLISIQQTVKTHTSKRVLTAFKIKL